MDYEVLYNYVYNKGKYTFPNLAHGGWHDVAEDFHKKYIKPPYSALSAGCGWGGLLMYLKEKGCLDIYGCDVADNPVKVCRDKGFNAEKASILDLPYKDNRFEVVYCTDVLEHLESGDVERGISELKRVAEKFVCLRISTMKASGNWSSTSKFGTGGNLHLTIENGDFCL